MQVEPSEIPARVPVRIHARALALTAVLLGAFLAASGLYSVYGYRFVLYVFEVQQGYRAEAYDGYGAAEQYEDYLRADPTSLRVRGRLVDQWIRLAEYDKALQTAEAAPAALGAKERSLPGLLRARALLARGELQPAQHEFEELLRISANSNEAHYGLGWVYASGGDFPRMREEFAAARRSPLVASTEEFTGSFRAANTSLPVTDESDAVRIARVLSLVRAAQIGEALDAIRTVDAFEGAPAEASFWGGVAEEEAGNVEAARALYLQSSNAGCRLAMSAVKRLDQAHAPSRRSGDSRSRVVPRTSTQRNRRFVTARRDAPARGPSLRRLCRAVRHEAT